MALGARDARECISLYVLLPIPRDVFEGMDGLQGLLLLKVEFHFGVALIHVYPMGLPMTDILYLCCAGPGGLFALQTQLMFPHAPGNKGIMEMDFN